VKRCKTCGEAKPLTEFYKQAQNRDGHKTSCKQCTLNQHQPVDHGTKTCRSCLTEKPVQEFTTQRTNRGGRCERCKQCCNARNAVRRVRERGGAPSFMPPSHLRSDDATYKKATCVICDEPFSPLRQKQINCGPCSKVARRIQHLIGNSRRGGRRRFNVPYANARRVARAYVQATACCYCARPFTDDNQKTMDHVEPVHAGGAVHDPNNIAIACEQCNRSKAWLPLADWLSLCVRVATRVSLIIAPNTDTPQAPEIR
jgi:5-methylcytosine-specific restriction endonuclease McrA